MFLVWSCCVLWLVDFELLGVVCWFALSLGVLGLFFFLFIWLKCLVLLYGCFVLVLWGFWVVLFGGFVIFCVSFFLFFCLWLVMCVC